MRSVLRPAILVLCASGATAQPAAEPVGRRAITSDTHLLPAEAAMVFGVDVTGFFASSFYAQLMGKGLPGMESQAAEMRESFTKGMADAEKEVGVRFDRDVDHVAFAMAAPQPGKKGDAVMIVRGRFDQARIEKALQAAPAKGKRSTRKVQGITLHVAEEAQSTTALAFLNDGLIAFGELPLVEAAVGAHATRKRPLDGNALLSARLEDVRPGSGFYMIMGGAALDAMKTGPEPPPFPLPRALAFVTSFDGGTDLTLAMASAAEATSMVDVLKGLIAMVRMQVQQNPQANKIPGFLEMTENLSIQPDGDVVRLSSPPNPSGGMGIMAAIIVPSLLKARVSANESSAIGDVRTVISAQAAYQSESAGYYGDLGCLGKPTDCMPRYKGPVFLGADLAAGGTKTGYVRAFHAGPQVPKRARTFDAYAYTAVPAEPGKSGTRSFCGDSTGVVRFDAKGGDIKPVNGACPESLPPLQ
jgi:type IV pilus assembly protein PilA